MKLFALSCASLLAILLLSHTVFCAGLFGSGSGKVAPNGGGEVPYGTCRIDTDCRKSRCLFYERCCLYGVCYCGTSGREQACRGETPEIAAAKERERQERIKKNAEKAKIRKEREAKMLIWTQSDENDFIYEISQFAASSPKQITWDDIIQFYQKKFDKLKVYQHKNEISPFESLGSRYFFYFFRIKKFLDKVKNTPEAERTILLEKIATEVEKNKEGVIIV
ncbi:MAG: hypothetical protein EXX96DRAFT_555954, partial [Benjaminiella poitrasii]